MPLAPIFHSIEDFYRRIYWCAPDSQTRAACGYTLSYSGTPWLYGVNHLWLHDPSALTDDQMQGAIDEARTFFRQFHADYTIVCTEAITTDPAEADRFSACGCIVRSRVPLLALTEAPLITHAHQDLQIIPVTAITQLDFSRVLRETFYLGPELIGSLIGADRLQDTAIRHYVGYLSDQPVGCATLIMSEDGVTSLWNIGTVFQSRRRGIAGALISRALTDAAERGCSASALLASPIGRPLYESIGYRLIGYNVSYTRP